MVNFALSKYESLYAEYEELKIYVCAKYESVRITYCRSVSGEAGVVQAAVARSSPWPPTSAWGWGGTPSTARTPPPTGATARSRTSTSSMTAATPAPGCSRGAGSGPWRVSRYVDIHVALSIYHCWVLRHGVWISVLHTLNVLFVTQWEWEWIELGGECREDKILQH